MSLQRSRSERCKLPSAQTKEKELSLFEDTAYLFGCIAGHQGEYLYGNTIFVSSQDDLPLGLCLTLLQRTADVLAESRTKSGFVFLQKGGWFW